MIAFPSIALPGPAYRRSYFAHELARLVSVFPSLLAQLAPDVYRALKDKSAMGCYGSLLRYIDANLFPIFDTWILDVIEDLEIDPASEAEGFGIPVHVLGLDDEDLVYNIGSPSITLAYYLCWTSSYSGRPALDTLAALEKFPEVRRQYQELFTVKHFHKPPRGRRWTPPWDALKLLCDYSQNGTGYRWLDYSHIMVEEVGGYPPWHIDEIRALAREWKRTQPVWERLKAIIEHVDARPTERLPLLGGALCGEKQARLQISQPEHSKTLAEALA